MLDDSDFSLGTLELDAKHMCKIEPAIGLTSANAQHAAALLHKSAH